MRIAIYGKGGIGKSTVAANVSALLSKRDMSVLQVGCDPKHDSTLLLVDGELTTVLSGLSSENKLTVNDIVKRGKGSIDCIEIGGPAPGVGCAGRGIIKGLEIIKRLGVYSKEYDCIIYDILGDVVCGGFFEPLKGGFVDKMYIVTSGEFNSLFAANNLCKGYINCNLFSKGVKMGGIIGNCRGIENEEQLINEFCNRINVPLVAMIPRDNKIEKSTFEGIPVIDSVVNPIIIAQLENIADSFCDEQKESFIPKALELNELRELCKEIRFV